jgi:hypothetical protein
MFPRHFSLQAFFCEKVFLKSVLGSNLAVYLCNKFDFLYIKVIVTKFSKENDWIFTPQKVESMDKVYETQHEKCFKKWALLPLRKLKVWTNNTKNVL